MKKQEQIRLVKKAKKGDDDAFISLCEAYQQVIYHAAYKILLNHADACDCIQETEFKAWQQLPNLKNEVAFNTWFFKIMVNVANTMLTNKKKYVDLADYHMVNQPLPEQQHDGLNELLEALPDKYRITLVLYYYAGFSIKAIALQQHLSVNTVKTRLSRGREMLKTRLEMIKHD